MTHKFLVSTLATAVALSISATAMAKDMGKVSVTLNKLQL